MLYSSILTYKLLDQQIDTSAYINELEGEGETEINKIKHTQTIFNL